MNNKSIIFLLAIPIILTVLIGTSLASASISIPYTETKELTPVVTTGSQVYYPSGTYYFTETDLSISARSIPMVWERTYRSNRVLKKNTQLAFGEPADGPLGFGWMSPWFIRIEGDAFVNEQGRYFYFAKDSTGNYLPNMEAGYVLRKTATGYELIETGANTYTFDASGKLTSIKDPRGNTATLTYNAENKLQSIKDIMGRTIFTFTHNTGGRISSVTDIAGRTINYEYDAIGNLIKVSSTLNSQLLTLNSYTYNGNHGILTKANALQETYTIEYYPAWVDKGVAKRIIDPVGTELIKAGQQPTGHETTFIYDFTNRVFYYTDYRGITYKNIMNEKGQMLSIDEVQNNQAIPVTKTEYLENRITKTTDVLGNVTTIQKDEWGNIIKKVDPEGNEWKYTYSQSKLLSTTDPLGTIIAYEYDTYGNKIKETLASGTTDESTTIYTYNQYNELTATTKGSATTYYTYNETGSLTEMKDPMGNTTTMTYDSVGNLLTITRPLIGTTTYENYDFKGTPQKTTDPNGNITLYTYDILGRIKTITNQADGAVTQYFYVTTSGSCPSCGSGGGTGEIDYIISPEGNKIDYDYDNTGTLIKIADNDGNSINYTYDSKGNRTREDIKDPSGIIHKTVSYEYDQLRRLIKIINPDGSYTLNSYDARGNRVAVKNPNGNTTAYIYDTPNRLSKVMQPGGVQTAYTYDKRGNLTSVTDANGNKTTYEFDNQSRLTTTISPDTGTTTYTYDLNGNLKTKTDANGVMITYEYDATNRLTKIDFPDTTQTITYTHDICKNGKGRLCKMTDQSGITTYEYDTKGQIVKETKIIDNITYITEYGYDKNGNLKTMKYPSGRVITYNYSNDKIKSVLNNATAIADNSSYKPYGGMTSITYGNGINSSIAYDNQYRIASIQTGAVQNLSYAFDARGNITGITNNLDATKNKSFTYDVLDRLTGATGPWGALTYSYDGVGNRQREINNSEESNYVYSANKLSSTSGAKTYSFSYDSNGNTIAENTRQYIYSQNQRLIKVTENGITKGEYVYNGNGQRVKKRANNQTTIFHYDLQGMIMAESTTAGAIIAEYIFWDGSPFAKTEGNSVYYYHNDHLGTPQTMTDSSGNIIWGGEFLPFGEPFSIVGTITNNLRFPGQYYDAEIGLNYNYFRDYNPVIGRYVEADPIGLRGGVNIYRFSNNSPSNYIDLRGLSCEQITPWEKTLVYEDPNNKGRLLHKYDRKKWKKIIDYNALPIPDKKGRVAKIACCCNWELIGYERSAVYAKDVLYEATFRCCDDLCSRKCTDQKKYKTFSSTYRVDEGPVTSFFNYAVIRTCGSYLGDGSCGCDDPNSW
ncbi:MAG: YD repeat protein [Nitrospirae bacterium]|nr:MAG: YD repeat protein [Nitrospirota bacterium]